ncbi:TspO/MBR family protein [Bombiscardovia coagulans]|uniref:Tryptophan-rich sensory protein n=1 Tax=Bombiscardovia coagulans TaxID=686666 RepID=A0A261EVM9_9BIFI|nr:TspO/MBR family protein [Bombiscardovia coagulans]OZG50924.1 hypothetical protein BOCO_0110 [Bombiscardovia coagulans]
MSSHDEVHTQSPQATEPANPSIDRKAFNSQQIKTPSVLEAEQSAHESMAETDARAERRWKLIETVILWASWIIMVGFNAYAEIFRLFGTTTGQIAKEQNVWFMPDGPAFAIWGLIYIGLGVWLIRFCIAGPSRKRLGKLPITLSGLIFVGTCILNIAWLSFWHLRSYTISLILICALTVMVWLLYVQVRRDANQQHTSQAASLLDWGPLSLYGSWLVVASILNACYVVEVLSGGISDVIQAFEVIILLCLLLIVSFLMEQKAKDWVFGLVVFWSAVNIGLRLFAHSMSLGIFIIVLAAVGDLITYFPWGTFKLVHR